VQSTCYLLVYVNMLVVLWVDFEKGLRPSARPTETRPAHLPATQQRWGRAVALLNLLWEGHK
jgi:hypothetical protein